MKIQGAPLHAVSALKRSLINYKEEWACCLPQSTSANEVLKWKELFSLLFYFDSSGNIPKAKALHQVSYLSFSRLAEEKGILQFGVK